MWTEFSRPTGMKLQQLQLRAGVRIAFSLKPFGTSKRHGQKKPNATRILLRLQFATCCKLLLFCKSREALHNTVRSNASTKTNL